MDTGFSGFVLVPVVRILEARNLGVKVKAASGQLAGSVGVETSVCYALVEQVEEHVPREAIAVTLTFYGTSSHGLLGRGFLKRWIAEFDGPRSLLTVFEET